MKSASLLLSTLFFIISGLHFFWSFGGTWALNKAIPTLENGEQVLQPTTFDSFLIALIVLGFSAFYLVLGGFIKIQFLERLKKVLKWVIPILFLMRAIGDFNFVGFLKVSRNTNFTFLDTYFFSPLCLGIALLGFLVIKLYPNSASYN